jgi:indolepyruvate ferredoxin oxidoreductase beta subunit
MKFDVFLVGVGGQGILTIGELLAEAAHRKGILANYYPIKGMAQRGGFVRAEVRMNSKIVGPHICERGADLVIAMEVSEALKAVRFIKPGGDFILFGYVWKPTAVMLGKATYPAMDQVLEQVKMAGTTLRYLDPEGLPNYEGSPAPANIYVLGAALAHSKLGKIFDPGEVSEVIHQRWNTGVNRNAIAYRAGLEVSL